MHHDDNLDPAAQHEAPAGSGRRADAPAGHRRHASRAAHRAAKSGGNHRSGAGRPGPKAVAVAVGAALAVGGSCLLLINPGSGADQALAADASATTHSALATASTTATPSTDPRSPRRHKPTPTPTAGATETPDKPHTPSPTATPEEHTQPTHQTPVHQPRVNSGGGHASVPVRSGGATGKAAAYAQKVVELVNAQRAQHGCRPLTVDAHIQKAAQAHSDDMAARNYYDHNSPEGVDPGTRMTNAGFNWQSWGENIFKSPTDPATAVDGWMNSPGHRANILNCSFTSTGVGVNLSSNGPWWTQDFGTRG
ncbi:CAP domain-containing protein [Streptomyces sp. NPDC093097]|uniref:CAP domain-containing protein n=1 Tax=Streptomyces sp. NPDC093097 TaxID=3366027 RepID=UPI003816C7FB